MTETAMTVTKRDKPADRDPQTGRFLTGNPGGPGNPYAARVGELRAALLDAVKPGDLAAIVKTLVAAAKVVFERVLGRPLEADILQRLDDLEARIGGQEGGERP